MYVFVGGPERADKCGDNVVKLLFSLAETLASVSVNNAADGDGGNGPRVSGTVADNVDGANVGEVSGCHPTEISGSVSLPLTDVLFPLLALMFSLILEISFSKSSI